MALPFDNATATLILLGPSPNPGMLPAFTAWLSAGCPMPVHSSLPTVPVVMMHAMMPSKCLYLGDMTSFRQCQTCSGKVMLKVFNCNHPKHSETTLSECQSCQDHSDLIQLSR